MDTKEWLSRGWKLNDEIKTLEDECEEARSIVSRVTTLLSPDKVQTSMVSYDQKLVTYLEYKMTLEKAIFKLLEVKNEIEQTIQQLEDSTYRNILRLRYIRFMTWEQIALEVCYSYRQTCRLHGEALGEINHVIESHNQAML